MGNNNGKADAKPLHTVTLNNFYMGKYEVTQELWQQVMGIEKGRKLDCMQCPVYDVSMENIQVFLSKLNQLAASITAYQQKQNGSLLLPAEKKVKNTPIAALKT